MLGTGKGLYLLGADLHPQSLSSRAPEPCIQGAEIGKVHWEAAC